MRDGVIGLFLWLIALITLVIGPILLLLFFELQFLPYHNETITWWQRIAVGIDLGLLWLFWPRIALRKADPALKGDTRFRIAHAIQSGGTIGIMLILTLGSLPLLLLIATFPGEKLAQTVQDLIEKPARAWIPAKYQIPVRVWFVAGRPNKLTRRPDSLFSDRLVLPGFEAISTAKPDSEEKTAAAAKPLSLRGRDLRGTVLSEAILSKADFTGAHLENADLSQIHLDGAFLQGAHLQGADLSYAHLQRTSLNYAYLQGTDLNNANFEGAYLREAHLQGADLSSAKLRGAFLKDADFQGADLQTAALQGAFLSSIDLQGYDPDQSAGDPKGPDLTNIRIPAADLSGADLSSAQLQGANFAGAQLQGADLHQVSILGTKISDSGLREAWVSETKAERWDEKIDTFIGRITNSIPAGEYRDRARQRLDAWLQNTQKDDEFSAIWRKAANSGRPDGFDQIVDDVWREIACSADGAPYVMSSLISRLGNLADKDRAARLAKGFQAETCQGRKGLSADDLTSLKKKSAPAPPQEAGQPQR